MGVMLQQGWTSAELERLDIPVAHLPLARSFDISWVRRMAAYIRKNDIKLIHAHEFSSNCYSLLAARLTGTPIICTAHGKNYYPDRYYRRFAYRRVASYADEFVAVSHDLKDFIIREVGIAPSRIRVVHNGIDTGVFNRQCHDRSATRKMLGIEPAAYVIIVVAALFEMKGHKELINALASLESGKENLCVLFVGDGNYRQELQRQAADCALEGVIRFLGFRSDIPSLLTASDLFVLPSYSEGLPVSVLEAMAAGVPVIVTDVGGLKEVVRDGENALLVPPRSSSELTDKIAYCMGKGLALESMTARAREDVVRSFGLDAMLTSYRNLYSRLLSS